ncbi:MAG: sporulation protein YqfD [Clostridiales bacterium]|nr:sporulation protein YqfD [Clostridiales bacterium]
MNIFNFFRGYVRLNIDGFFLERFLNIASHHNIFVWNIKRLGAQRISICVSNSGFQSLQEIADKTDSTVSVISHHGLHHLMQKYRGRTSFAIGGVLFIIAILVTSMFIWQVKIDYDGTRIPHETLQQAAISSGAKVGIWRFGLQNDKIANQIMLNVPEVAWVGVTIDGTCINIQARERIPAPLIVDEKTCHSYTASKPGVIDSIVVRQGSQLVKKGDSVSAGQLLVSGVIDSPTVGTRYVASDAIISAHTWNKLSAVIPDTIEDKTRAGGTKSKHTLQLFNWYIPLYISDKVDFAEYERDNKLIQAHIGEKLYLPFWLHYDKFYNIETTYTPISRDESILRTKQMLYNQIVSSLEPDTQITGETQDITTTDSGAEILNLTLECTENIGIRQRVDAPITNTQTPTPTPTQ